MKWLMWEKCQRSKRQGKCNEKVEQREKKERERNRLTAQANTAHEPNVYDIAVAETCCPEVHPYLRGLDQIPPTGLVGQKTHHQVLQQTLRMFQLDIGAPRGVRRLLQEDGVTGDFGNVDGNAEALAGEDGVHDRYVLVREVAADRENQDACQERRRWGGGELGCGSRVIGVARTGRERRQQRDLFVCVGEGESEGACHGCCWYCGEGRCAGGFQ